MIKSAEEFVALRSSEHESNYSRATNEEAELTTRMNVIKHFPDHRQWVANNKTAPVEILEVLSEDSLTRVRFAVASKRKLPLQLQLTLARDADERVRNRLVNTAKTQTPVLEILSKDEWPVVADHANEGLANHK